MKNLFGNLVLNFIGLALASAAWAAPSDDFVITVKTNNAGTSSSTRFTIPTAGSGYNYAVDLNNDNTPEYTNITGNTTCVFAAAGTYTIRIQGTFPRIYFTNTGDCQKILSVDQWGTGAWSSMANAFSGCTNLQGNATDVPNLTNVTSMSYMFYNASAFNQAIGSWNVANVTDMSFMFCGAISFNQAIGSWNVGNVTDMRGMFYAAYAFNQAIGSWNVLNVTHMGSMFYGAGAFNQAIGSWNVANVTSMSSMFYNASAFNQAIGSWNVANVTDMSSMFFNANTFNQAIGSWNVANVTNMSGMFQNANAFNQAIGSWNVANVTNMDSMFSYASAFNQPLDSWNVAKVTNMGGMFSYASAFNQAIGSWDVAKVTNMGGMFSYASAFNQAIGSWNVANVTDMGGMFYGATLSNSNYDQLLIGWGGQNVQNGVSFHGGNSRYTNGAEARQNLITNKSWSITDGGYLAPTPTITPTITPTMTITPTATPTFTITSTSTQTVTFTVTPTLTVSATMTQTATTTPSATITPSPTVSPERSMLDLQGKKLLAYPNPGKEKITIAFLPTSNGEVKIQIYNMSGERVATLNAQVASSDVTSVIWNCGIVAPGLYMVRVLQDGKEIGKIKVAVVR